MRAAATLIVLLLSSVATADPLPVRWGQSNACEHCKLSGPYQRIRRYQGQHEVRVATLKRPPRPYHAVRVLRTTADHDEGNSLDLAVKVGKRWYLRNLGEGGKSYWPHNERRTDQTITVESIDARQVVAGGAEEIVVITKIVDHLHGDSRREAWVFSVEDGVPVSINPIDGVDPESLP